MVFTPLSIRRGDGGEAVSLIPKTNLGTLEWGFLSDEKLRVQDSNMRPPGYEPGELPTAPTRDIK